MAIDANDLIKKAESILDTLDGIPSKNKLETPSQNYAENYNSLRSLAETIVKESEKNLLPPKITIEDDAMMGTIVNTKYLELESYVREIRALLKK